MKLLLKILLFLLSIFQTNICEAKEFEFNGVVCDIIFSDVFNSEKSGVEIDKAFSENDFANTCKSEIDLLDYRNLLLSSIYIAYAAKTGGQGVNRIYFAREMAGFF